MILFVQLFFLLLQIRRRFLRQRRYRHLLHALDLLLVDQERQNRPHLLVDVVFDRLLLHGLILGRIRVPHQLDSDARFRSHGLRTLLASRVRRVQHRVLHRHHSVHANLVRRIPTGSNFRTHDGESKERRRHNF